MNESHKHMQKSQTLNNAHCMIPLEKPLNGELIYGVRNKNSGTLGGA